MRKNLALSLAVFALISNVAAVDLRKEVTADDYDGYD